MTFPINLAYVTELTNQAGALNLQVVNKPSFIAGVISIAIGGVAYLYLGMKTDDSRAVTEVTAPRGAIVEPSPPSDFQENKSDDADSIPAETVPTPPQKKLETREVEKKTEQPPQPSQDSELERQIYASLENVGVTRMVVIVRDGKVRISGQLLREADRVGVLERVRSITDWDVDDGLVFMPDRWLAYRTLNQTYVYSEPSQSSPRISSIGSQYRVWVTEIRDKWVRVESKKGARPGYVRRVDVVPEDSEQ